MWKIKFCIENASNSGTAIALVAQTANTYTVKDGNGNPTANFKVPITKWVFKPPTIGGLNI